MNAALNTALVPILAPHPRETWLTSEVVDAFAAHVLAAKSEDHRRLVDHLARRQRECHAALGKHGPIHEARLVRIAAADPTRTAHELLAASLL